MPIPQTVTFQEAIEVIELLPEYQQENLVDILQHRLIEHRRDLIAENIKEARNEVARGEIKRGTASDFMRELSE